MQRNHNTKTHCRCTKCGRRQVKRMHPDQYLRRPKCYYCKGRIRMDKWMQNRWRTYVTCHSCDGYYFPHRQGSKQCEYRKDGTRRYPGDHDYFDPQQERQDEYSTFD